MRIKNDCHFSINRNSRNNNRTHNIFWNEVRRVVGVQKVRKYEKKHKGLSIRLEENDELSTMEKEI